MTQEEKAKAYDEALEKARAYFENENYTEMADVFPELTESEDERIRKVIYKLMLVMREEIFTSQDEIVTKEKVLAYLEKQKERDLDIVPELRATAWGEGYQHGRKDTEEKYSGMMVCSPEEWNEAISDAFKHGMDEGEKQKEKKPNIELIQKSWYMEGYHDRKFNKEPKWIINTGEGGPWYEENPKYGQVIEETPKVKDPFDNEQFCRGYEAGKHDAEREREINTQKPVEWSEEDRKNLELVIDCIYDLYPDPVMKYKLKDWLKNLPERFNLEPKTEWSDEDKAIVNCIVCCLDGQFVPESARKQSLEWFNKHRRDFLNSPSWKPSEEQMKALDKAIPVCMGVGWRDEIMPLESLYEQLKKL